MGESTVNNNNNNRTADDWSNFPVATGRLDSRSDCRTTLLHKPNSDNNMGSTGTVLNDVDMWFTVFSQLDDSPELSREICADDNTRYLSPISNSLNTHLVEWMQLMRTWYADTVVAIDFPSHPSRTTKSRYKKRNSAGDDNMGSTPTVQLPRLPLNQPPFLVSEQRDEELEGQQPIQPLFDPSFQNQKVNKKRKLSSSVTNIFSQGTEYALAYKQSIQNHDGPEKAAFSCLIQWNHGQAVSSIRYRGATVEGGKLIFAEETPIDWRVKFSQPISLYGDYRQIWKKSIESSEETSPNVPQLSHHLQQDVNKTWKAVRACAISIRRQIMDRRNSPKLYFSSIVHFLCQSAMLPLPTNQPNTKDSNSHDDDVDETDSIMQEIADACWKTRKLFTTLLDSWGTEDGIDIDFLRKQVETAENESQLVLDYTREMHRQLDAASDWQRRLDVALKELEVEYIEVVTEGEETENDLSVLEMFNREGNDLGFRPKDLVALEGKLQRAHQLRDRITNWKDSSKCNEEKKETMKFLVAIVREVNRVKLRFPEVHDLLRFHQKAEAWVDRASIAIRSRMSLEEIKSLVQTGKIEIMPLVDLSEYVEKLDSRVVLAEDWLEQFNRILSLDGKEDSCSLEKMKLIRTALDDKEQNCLLHDLASEASRIPVDVECMKLLQIELDSRGWSSKTKKWIPLSSVNGDDNCENETGPAKRVGKLEELRDHLAKASVFRDRLISISSLSDEKRSHWILDGESELTVLVEAADNWLEKYQAFLDIDGRKNDERNSISLAELRKIVSEGSLLYVNIGTPMTKIGRILTQGENWYKTYKPVLVQCGVETGEIQLHNVLQVLEKGKLIEAIDAAQSDVSVDLEEAAELELLLKQIEDWERRVLEVIGDKRSKKGAKRCTEFTLNDLTNLISQGSTFPVNVKKSISLLQSQVDAVAMWQLNVAKDIKSVTTGFLSLREALVGKFGQPNCFVREKTDPPADLSTDENNARSRTSINSTDKVDHEDDDEKSITSLTRRTERQVFPFPETKLDANDKSLSTNVPELTKAFCTRSNAMCVRTPEHSVALHLNDVSDWCIRSVKYLEREYDFSDKKLFGAFDKFLVEGQDLLKKDNSTNFDIPTNSSTQCEDLEPIVGSQSRELFERLRYQWKGVIGDQLLRLNIVESDRKDFLIWCSNAEIALSEDGKRITHDKLTDITTKSYQFPSSSATIRRIRKMHSKAASWIASASCIIDVATDKVSFQEAKLILDEGEKLSVESNELKALRAGLKLARNWSHRVKKLKIGVSECVNTKHVKDLLDEYDSLVVTMQDEVALLRHATRNYCLCRRPYEGFMIGCDTCDEWFHGPCISVTEVKANQVTNYVCVRCCLSRIFKGSSQIIVDIIRKWTNKKELKKARRQQAQKHQRKVRKEVKDIEKYRELKRLLQMRLIDIGHQQQPVTINRDDWLHLQTTSIVSHLHSSLPFDNKNPVGKPKNEQYQTGPGLVDLENVSIIPPNLTREEILARIAEIVSILDECNTKLDILTRTASQRADVETLEDSKQEILSRWCIRVRSLVLMPKSAILAQSSRPTHDGSLSTAMIKVISDAGRLGLTENDDVKAIANAFQCLCWSFRAISVFRKQATVDTLKSLLDQASAIELPDEKALRMMRALYQRCTNWESKLLKALTPCPGDRKPFNIEILKELSIAGDDIPVCMPLESRLLTVIEDNGIRHCVCGGPSDGRFMLACERCDRWYHGHCVQVSSRTPEKDLVGWNCPSCRGKPQICLDDLNLEKFHDYFDFDTDVRDSFAKIDNEVVSSISEDEDELWPPFGLFGSHGATEALGEECAAMPDVTDEWICNCEIKQSNGSKSTTITVAEIISPSPSKHAKDDVFPFAPARSLDSDSSTPNPLTSIGFQTFVNGPGSSDPNYSQSMAVFTTASSSDATTINKSEMSDASVLVTCVEAGGGQLLLPPAKPDGPGMLRDL